MRLCMCIYTKHTHTEVLIRVDKAYDLKAYDLKAYDLKAYDLKAYDLKAYDLQACSHCLDSYYKNQLLYLGCFRAATSRRECVYMTIYVRTYTQTNMQIIALIRMYIICIYTHAHTHTTQCILRQVKEAYT
jgi:hypothetical protein